MERIQTIQQKVDDASTGFTISIENILQVGFNHFRKAPGLFILYSIVAAAALSNPVSGLLLGGPVVAGYYIVIRGMKDQPSAGAWGFFRSFNKFGPFLLLNLLISAIVILGFLLLIIPGVFFSVSYLFSHLLVWFFDMEPSEAARLSRKMVSGNFTQILWLCLILAGINLLGALAFGIGLLATIPFSACVIYAVFDDIIGIP
ncbi:MAG: hypothetical protein V2B15_16035 [Bacteroidota bacterium]